MKFLNFIFSVQGYGLTEVAACTTLNAVDEFVTEEVGPPNQVNPRIWIHLTQKCFVVFLYGEVLDVNGRRKIFLDICDWKLTQDNDFKVMKYQPLRGLVSLVPKTVFSEPFFKIQFEMIFSTCL